MLSLLLEMSLD